MLKVYRSDNTTFWDLSLGNLTKNCWFNLINPTPEELHTVETATAVPQDILRAALDEEERSRIEVEDQYILVLTNLPIIRGETSYDTLPLGIIITGDYIITVCLEANVVLSEFHPNFYRTFNTAKRTRFLFQILYKTTIHYLKYLRQINRQTDQIELDLRKSMKNKEIIQLMELQRGLTYFNASLRTNGAVMEKLLRLRSTNQSRHLISMYEEDEDLLEDVIIENNQAIQMVDMYTNILSGMMDAFASIISNNLNMVMKFLASMTIILAVPTMLASFWGMNVPVPFTNHSFGFIFVIIIALGFTGVSAYTLWKKDMF
ncbi:MAG: magnesium transporter CorA family protein [Peptococcaceae bacterium]|jgi:magnesium transporter|nr:magnesium transporter CorA family protein [Peptococcaceae bacterium]